jgi:hypothetical protein
VPNAPATTTPTDTPDPTKLNPVSMVVSVNDGPFKNTSMTFSGNTGTISFSYDGVSYTVEGIDINPIFTDSSLLQYDN